MSKITITIKLFAQYREGKFKVEQRAYYAGVSVAKVIEEIGIDVKKYPIGVMIVNGRHVDTDFCLKDADTLSVFPKVGGG